MPTANEFPTLVNLSVELRIKIFTIPFHDRQNFVSPILVELTFPCLNFEKLNRLSDRCSTFFLLSFCTCQETSSLPQAYLNTQSFLTSPDRSNSSRCAWPLYQRVCPFLAHLKYFSYPVSFIHLSFHLAVTRKGRLQQSESIWEGNYRNQYIDEGTVLAYILHFIPNGIFWDVLSRILMSFHSLATQKRNTNNRNQFGWGNIEREKWLVSQSSHTFSYKGRSHTMCFALSFGVPFEDYPSTTYDNRVPNRYFIVTKTRALCNPFI